MSGFYIGDDLALSFTLTPGEKQLWLPWPTGCSKTVSTMAHLRGLNSSLPATGGQPNYGDLTVFGVRGDGAVSIRTGKGRPFRQWLYSRRWVVVRIMIEGGHLLLRWNQSQIGEWQIYCAEVWPTYETRGWPLDLSGGLTALLSEVCDFKIAA